jgi:hypothetical protein
VLLVELVIDLHDELVVARPVFILVKRSSRSQQSPRDKLQEVLRGGDRSDCGMILPNRRARSRIDGCLAKPDQSPFRCAAVGTIAVKVEGAERNAFPARDPKKKSCRA